MKKNKIVLILLLSCALIQANAKEYHVSPAGNNGNLGSESKPFKTINKAVDKAFPGDTITVHAGTFREWVKPLRGGLSNENRIVYRAAQNEKVEIKGSEIVTDWKKEKNGVWKVVVPNSFFGDYNPYQDTIAGDWFDNHNRKHHTGEVFLNGKSFYEVDKIENVFSPKADSTFMDVEGSTYTWYCESDKENTTIWANFHAINPNKEMTEISARKTCFFPEKPVLNYITIQGFEFSQAATQWAAPTAEQVGMVSTHWNKGWIIENNIIHDSRCVGITMGKERGTGHNVWTTDAGNINRDGNIHYIEVVFRVLRNGWNKENVGSHVVRGNTIYNCGQAGICGSMGAAFSTIENNHIYNIYTKRQYSGFEIGGIKFHGAIDVIIKNNRIHNASRGLWLDWMTQGTRVTQNLFYNNDTDDIFLEVNHGPFLVDNNILLSPISINTQSQGGAYVHNLCTGLVNAWPEPNRFTPYFLPHSTDIAGLTTIYGGDDRFYNNIFVGKGNQTKDSTKVFGLERYNSAKLKVYMDGNVYYNNAKPSNKDTNSIVSPHFNLNIEFDEKNGLLAISFNEAYTNQIVKIINTEIMGKTKITKAFFDNPDGSPIKIDCDYFGKKRTALKNHAGPFSEENIEKVELKLW